MEKSSQQPLQWTFIRHAAKIWLSLNQNKIWVYVLHLIYWYWNEQSNLHMLVCFYCNKSKFVYLHFNSLCIKCKWYVFHFKKSHDLRFFFPSSEQNYCLWAKTRTRPLHMLLKFYNEPSLLQGAMIPTALNMNPEIDQLCMWDLRQPDPKCWDIELLHTLSDQPGVSGSHYVCACVC